MKVLPTSVSIVAWLLIVVGIGVCLFAIPTIFVISGSGVFLTAYVLVVSVGLAATLVSGIGMLKAQNWSRWLYVAGTIIGNIFNIAAGRATLFMIPAFLVFLFLVFLLFRPNANRYFSRTEKG